jgi:hypothetical protein
MMIAALISACHPNLKRKSKMLSRFALAILAAALSILPAVAQTRGGGVGTAGFGISVGPPVAGHGTSMGGAAHFHQGHAPGRGNVLLSYPYFYSDSDYYAGEVSQQPPQVIVVSAAPAPASEPPALRESLLIEWQGDHFVRTTSSSKISAGAEQTRPDDPENSASHLSFTGQAMTGQAVTGQAMPRQPGTRQTATKQKKADQPAPELPPAVLVFHDGRREEVSEYSIISGTIYSKADYWTTGSWTRKIQIADLDVPTTLKLNQERGVNFVLPTSPNQIVIRP